MYIEIFRGLFLRAVKQSTNKIYAVLQGNSMMSCWLLKSNEKGYMGFVFECYYSVYFYNYHSFTPLLVTRIIHHDDVINHYVMGLPLHGRLHKAVQSTGEFIPLPNSILATSLLLMPLLIHNVMCRRRNKHCCATGLLEHIFLVSETWHGRASSLVNR